MRWAMIPGNLNEQGQLPQPDRDRTLEDVRSDFAGRVCPSGPYGEIDEWSLYDESFRRLVAWAIDCECFFEGLRPLKEGGREHDLTFHAIFSRLPELAGVCP